MPCGPHPADSLIGLSHWPLKLHVYVTPKQWRGKGGSGEVTFWSTVIQGSKKHRWVMATRRNRFQILNSPELIPKDVSELRVQVTFFHFTKEDHPLSFPQDSRSQPRKPLLIIKQAKDFLPPRTFPRFSISCSVKGEAGWTKCGFHSQLGGINRLVFLSHIYVSLSLPLPLYRKSIKMYF